MAFNSLSKLHWKQNTTTTKPTTKDTTHHPHEEEQVMSVFTAQVIPGQGLGFLVLGASLHDILTRLKAEPQRFPKLDLIYEHFDPVRQPVILSLPNNGIRLRFDGPEQRLRLIEVLDFTTTQLTYKNGDVFRAATAVTGQQETLSGPTFRHIYHRLMGATFDGEYNNPTDGSAMGTYVLSYPGVAFSFPLQHSALSSKKDKDMVALLSSSAARPASSMAIFKGQSWPDVRNELFEQILDPREAFANLIKNREPVPDEVRLVRIHGAGQLELLRAEGISPFRLWLGHTTPQELVAILGPPDAIYRKNDQRMAIHNPRPASRTHGRSDSETRLRDDSTDTDQSSAYTATDESEDEDEAGENAGNVSGECFYNYFYHGFDILLSTPAAPSQLPPSLQDTETQSFDGIIPADASTRLVATKIILHGNVPGSYPFNRHRRCRWEISYLKPKKGQAINSESPFKEIEKRLHDEWQSIYKSPEEAKNRQRGMVLNRDWGDSPGSSCELLGGWEESVGEKRTGSGGIDDVKGLGNTTLFGFPGMVFEVLKNGTVSGVTVF